jgi:AcrR family transcriptional regulator
VPERRPYFSKRRAQQAAQTREDVLDAAVELFATAGWSGTTLTGLASRAGVAVETVYAGFGSKKQVLRAVLDDVVVPPAVAEPAPRSTREHRVHAVVGAVAAGHDRSARVWRALLEAASGDGEVEQQRVELERRRRVEVADALQRAVGADLDPLLLDLLWAVLGPDVHLHLVVDAGWSREDYESALVDAVQRLVRPRTRRASRVPPASASRGGGARGRPRPPPGRRPGPSRGGGARSPAGPPRPG